MAEASPPGDVLAGNELVAGAVGDHRAGAQHDDALCPLADQLHVVGGDDGGVDDVLHLLQHVDNFPPGGDVQVGGRLIQQQHPGI